MSRARLKIGTRTRWALAVFAICVVVYVLMLLLIPRFYGTTTADGDEPSYLLMTQSLINDGDLFLENNSNPATYGKYYEREITFWPWVPGRGGNLVSTHPAFLSLVILPGFWLFGYPGAALTMIVLFGIAAALTFAVADRFVTRKIAFGVTLFFFLTYPLLFYSRKVYPDTAVAFALSLGVWSAWRLRETKKPVYAAVGGLSAGMVSLLHPKYFAISLSLALLMILVTRKDWRMYAWWLLPAVACLALLVGLTYMAYGTSLLRGLTATAGGSVVTGYSSGHEGWGVLGLFLDRSAGLFLFAPLFLLFPVGLSLQSKRSEWTRWWLFFPVCVGAQAVVAGMFQYWNGGFAMIPRYTISLAPVLIIPVALFFDRCRSVVAYVFEAVLASLQLVMTAGAFAFVMGTYAMYAGGDVFLRHFLHHTWLKGFILSAFPDFRSESWGALVVAAAWIALYAVAIYFARRSFLKRGGLKASPLLEG